MPAVVVVPPNTRRFCVPELEGFATASIEQVEAESSTGVVVDEVGRPSHDERRRLRVVRALASSTVRYRCNAESVSFLDPFRSRRAADPLRALCQAEVVDPTSTIHVMEDKRPDPAALVLQCLELAEAETLEPAATYLLGRGFSDARKAILTTLTVAGSSINPPASPTFAEAFEYSRQTSDCWWKTNAVTVARAKLENDYAGWVERSSWPVWLFWVAHARQRQEPCSRSCSETMRNFPMDRVVWGSPWFPVLESASGLELDLEVHAVDFSGRVSGPTSIPGAAPCGSLWSKSPPCSTWSY